MGLSFFEAFLIDLVGEWGLEWLLELEITEEEIGKLSSDCFGFGIMLALVMAKVILFFRYLIGNQIWGEM